MDEILGNHADEADKLVDSFIARLNFARRCGEYGDMKKLAAEAAASGHIRNAIEVIERYPLPDKTEIVDIIAMKLPTEKLTELLKVIREMRDPNLEYQISFALKARGCSEKIDLEKLAQNLKPHYQGDIPADQALTEIVSLQIIRGDLKSAEKLTLDIVQQHSRDGLFGEIALAWLERDSSKAVDVAKKIANHKVKDLILACIALTDRNLAKETLALLNKHSKKLKETITKSMQDSAAAKTAIVDFKRQLNQYQITFLTRKRIENLQAADTKSDRK